MTAIDRWLGRPLCAALTMVRYAARLVPNRPSRGPLRKILFIKMAEQGATVLAYRALCRAVEMVGRENVYFWVFEENRPVLDLLDVIPKENVITVRSDNLVTFAIDIARSLLRIRELRIDATVDMEFLARAPAIFAFLTGATRRAGLHRFTVEGPYRGDLLTHRVQHNPYHHAATAYYVLVEALQCSEHEVPQPKRPPPSADWAPPKFLPTAEERERVRALLEREAGRPLNPPIVLLNPNASDLLPLRKWATERFVDLGRRVLEGYPEAIVAITGAPSERAAAESVAAAIDPARAISLAGKTNLRELFVLYTLADAMVTNDSGPGHFASMTDMDTLVLFGPETPALFRPLGAHSHVLWAGLACSPCINPFNHRISPCSDNVCMQAIDVDRVYLELREILNQRLTAAASAATAVPLRA